MTDALTVENIDSRWNERKMRKDSIKGIEDSTIIMDMRQYSISARDYDWLLKKARQAIELGAEEIPLSR